MLRNFPAYLSYDLDKDIRPRTEFLKAFNKNPLANGLLFLLKATPKEIAVMAEVDDTLFKQFCITFDKQNTSILKNKRENE